MIKLRNNQKGERKNCRIKSSYFRSNPDPYENKTDPKDWSDHVFNLRVIEYSVLFPLDEGQIAGFYRREGVHRHHHQPLRRRGRRVY